MNEEMTGHRDDTPDLAPDYADDRRCPPGH